MGGGTVDSESDSDEDVRYSTPPPIEREPMDPKTPDIPALDGPRPDVGTESENEHALINLTGSPASRTKHRRSLHRTLRESHGGSSHRRSFKGRDSASTIGDESQESEGLARGKGSFTVHGKKASVIQFGSDWHNTTAEERLKTKKQLQEAAEAASADERDGVSIVSSGTATMSPTSASDGPEENTPRKLSTDVLKQRHVSSQTITPANFRESLKEQDAESDDSSEMSDIAEESPTKERTSAEQAAKKEPDTPTTTAIEPQKAES